MFLEAILLAFQAIRRNTLRSLLTVLGEVIGVAAVIAMVTLGSGTTQKVISDTSNLGTNLLMISPGQWERGGTRSSAPGFRDADVEAIRTEVPGLEAVAPIGTRGVTVVHGNDNWATSVTGSDNAYLSVLNWSLSRGRSFSDGELRSGSAVCVLGDTVRQKLFGSTDSIGETVRVGKIPCRIVGTLAPKGQGTFGLNLDDVILMPIRTFERRMAGSDEFGIIYASALDGVSLTKVKRDIEALLRERRGIGPRDEDDFTVQDMAELVSFLASTTSILTGLLGGIAAVSLLVGGIGIMNIMLVSVTERTREIGVRLAIGALKTQVLQQFLVEAVVLSLLGGVLGIAIGLGIGGLGTVYLGLPFVVSPLVVAGAFLFSALVGVVFGFFPARRAANLDPIVALRHE